MKNLNLFLRLTKVNAAKREVSGVATEEVPDKDHEIFDYASSVPLFRAWSDEINKATEGKSLGNVREMHQPKACGKLVDIEFDDANKRILVTAKIVDDAAWRKCDEGVYTGFSIGGRYIKTWEDGENIRFTARPSEISVVDNPCVYGAHFTSVKADGTEEMRKFKGGAEEPGKPGATVAHTAVVLIKGMYSVSSLASILTSAASIQIDSAYEAEYEGDNSPIPARLKQWVRDGADILRDLCNEEVSELTDAMKSLRTELTKKGAKHSSATMARLNAVDKCLKAMGDAHGEATKSMGDLLGKDDDDADKTDSGDPHPELTGEQNMNTEQEKSLNKAAADSSAALSKIAELEQAGVATKTELTKLITDGFAALKTQLEPIAAQSKEAHDSVSALVDGLGKATTPESGKKVAKTEVITVEKRNDGNPLAAPDAVAAAAAPAESASDLIKSAHKNPQIGSGR